MSEEPVTQGLNGLVVGRLYEHYKGVLYKITGFSTFSDEDEGYDGKHIVHYVNVKESWKGPYSCRLDRFMGDVDVPRFREVLED